MAGNDESLNETDNSNSTSAPTSTFVAATNPFSFLLNDDAEDSPPKKKKRTFSGSMKLQVRAIKKLKLSYAFTERTHKIS